MLDQLKARLRSARETEPAPVLSTNGAPADVKPSRDSGEQDGRSMSDPSVTENDDSTPAPAFSTSLHDPPRPAQDSPAIFHWESGTETDDQGYARFRIEPISAGVMVRIQICAIGLDGALGSSARVTAIGKDTHTARRA